MDAILSAAGLAMAALGLAKIAKTTYRVMPYLTAPKQQYLKGKGGTVVVTGSTDGIGREYVKWLTQNNYHVIAVGRNQNKLQEIVNINPSFVTPYHLDFTSVELSLQSLGKHCARIGQTITKDGGDSEWLGVINCVGMAHFCPYDRLSLQQVDQIHRTNINSFHLMMQLSNQQFKLRQTSHPFFINISSISAQHPSIYSSIYSASKAYLSNAMTAVSKEQPKITFLNIEPHYVTTKMVGNLKSWDTASPNQIVQGSMKLLGKRSYGAGCIRHQLLQEYIWAVDWWLGRRFRAMLEKADRMERLRRKKGE